VITTHPGQEFRVKAELERRAPGFAGCALRDVVVPSDQVTEIRNGQRVRTETRLVPGYVLVNLEMTDAAWALLRGTQGVAGMVGSENQPVPLSDAEVDRLLGRADTPQRPRVPFSIGVAVDVVAGPFVGLSGQVVALNEDAAKLKVAISMFGRETDAEVTFDQVKAR
jgi:transcriptional antiterminator NusG